MQKSYEELLRSCPILMGLCGLFYLINQLWINKWHTWSVFAGEKSKTIFDVISENPFILVAFLIIPISILFYILIKNQLKKEKVKANIVKFILLIILDAILIMFALMTLFVIYA